MIQLRYLKKIDGTTELQYRQLLQVEPQRMSHPDTHGFMRWTEWKTVPTVAEERFK